MFAASALLTSCNLNIESQGEKPQKDDTSVGFGVYMKRGVTTKSGYAGELTTEKLKTVANGFGVFSYYGNGALYNETSKPDFMYNQQVKFTTNGVWEYTPIKYWPNEYGAEAGSESADRLSFFAYAPYVEVTPSTGIVTASDNTDGILGMTRNIAAGDPMVMYGACLQPGGGVDLCWGVSADTFTSSVDGNKNNVQSGDPFIDVIKPKTGDRLTFEFNHALSQLNVQIDTDVDVESHATSTLDSKTRVYVRSVSFTGFTTRGSLNLNSKRGNPAWFDISGTGRLRRDPVTVYDGRSDGLEGVSTAADVNEEPAVLSPIIVQSKEFGTETSKESTGVTGETVNLFKYADSNSPIAPLTAPVMVVPIAGVPVTVTIVYDIETADPNLASFLSDGVTHGVSTENKITKTVQMNGQNMTLKPGMRYMIGLHLGLTSVKFDAEVNVWDDTEYKGTADLPENVPSLGTITITDATQQEIKALAVWKESSVSTPIVSVVDDKGQPVDGCQFIWASSEPAVATVANDGAVTLKGAAGTTTLTVTATKGDKTASKSYTLSVNEVTGITLDPATKAIAAGGTYTLTATIAHTNYGEITTFPTVSWTSSSTKFKVDPENPTATKDQDEDVMKATTTVKAAADVTATDRAEITASIGSPYANPDVTKTATVTGLDAREITAVTLDFYDANIWKFNQTQRLPGVTVTGTGPSDLTDLATCKWSSLDERIAKISDGGVILPQAPGVVTLRVTATYNNTKTADFTLYVNDVTGIKVTTDPSDMYVGGTLQVNASLVLNGDQTNQTIYGGALPATPSVTWESNNSPAISVVSPVEVDGNYVSTTTATAKTAGEAKITATIGTPYASSTQSSSITLKSLSKIGIDHVELSETSTTVWIGKGASLPTTVTVYGTDGNVLSSGYTLSWRSQTPSVATITTQPTGISLVNSGVATLRVTATIPEDTETLAASSKWADYTVNVNKVSKVTISSTSSKIVIGRTRELKATLEYNDTHSLNGASAITTWPTVAWESESDCISVPRDPISVTEDNPTVSIDASTTSTALADNQSEITATVGTDFVVKNTTEKDTYTLTCVNLVTASIAFDNDENKTDTTVWKADGARVPEVTVKGSDGSTLTPTSITWESITPNLATMDGSGVHLIGAGNAKLQVTVVVPASDVFDGATLIKSYTISSNEITAITVDPETIEIVQGGSTTLTATLSKTDYGTVSSLTDPTISWTSSTPANVTVPDGATGTSVEATGVGEGDSDVTATLVETKYLSSSADLSHSKCTITCTLPSTTGTAKGNGYNGWN